jgi:hypothetical protein
MTSDAASTQPRKRAWKRLIVALACVAAVVTIVLLANIPKKEPVTVWFVRSTGSPGHKVLVFQGTNGTPREIQFGASIFTGAIRQAKTTADLGPAYGYTSANMAAGKSFYFHLDAPPEDAPYYVAWGFQELWSPMTRWERCRMACFNFFGSHNMPRLARRFLPTARGHYIPSTEIKE